MSRFILALTAAFALSAQAPPAGKADFERLMKELSNWGRWGKDDELGSINHITAAKRRAAAKLVREGFPVSLSHDAEKSQAPDNPRPFVHEMINHGQTPNATSHGDLFTVAHHGLAHTHIDALSHFFHDGKMYNGFGREHVTPKGAAKLDVYRMKQGIFTRGILVDIPRLKNLPYLEPGTPILAADLDAWEKFARIKVQPGDVLLVRTGRWKLRAEKGPWNPQKLAGLHMSAVPWLKQHDIAIAGSDAALEVRPSLVTDVNQPVHVLVIAALGMPILDNLDLEAVAEAAAQRKRWDFLLTLSPLTVPGATGSATNPTAIF